MDLETVGVFSTMLVAVLTLPIGLLTLIFVGLQLGIAVFVVGWFLLVPLMMLVGGLLSERGRRSSSGASEDESKAPIEQLQQQYVDGEIDEDEFDRKLDRLLESTEQAQRDEGAGRSEDDRDRQKEMNAE